MVFIKKGRELGLKIGLYTNGTNVLLDTIVDNKKLIDYFDFISIDCKALLLIQDFYTPKQAKKLMHNFGILAESDKRINIRTTLVKQFHNEDTIDRMATYLSSLFDNKENVKWYLQEFKETSNILDPSYTSLSSFISKEPFIKLISEKFPSLNIDK
jgi:pyruvate-formate lyase-activating enzyme